MRTEFCNNPFKDFGYGNREYYREKASDAAKASDGKMKWKLIFILASIPIVNIVVSLIDMASRRFKKIDPNYNNQVNKTHAQGELILNKQVQEPPAQKLQEQLLVPENQKHEEPPKLEAQLPESLEKKPPEELKPQNTSVFQKLFEERSALLDEAIRYENGIGVDANLKKASELRLKASTALGEFKLESFNKCLAAAEKGDLEAERIVYACYRDGITVPKNEIKAFHFCAEAAKKRDPQSQFNLSTFYKDGIGVERSSETAFKWAKLAANSGYPEAEYFVAQCYMNGTGTEKNTVESREWFKKAVAHGQAEAQAVVGAMFLEKPDGKWHAYALDLLEKAAKQGNFLALRTLWRASVEGKGVPKNPRKAFEFCRALAEKHNDPKAQHSLGFYYATGFGVKKDPKVAAKHYKRVAEKIGLSIYQEGFDSKNAKDAFALYKEASQLGCPHAMEALAICYETGFGTLKNETLAVRWCGKGALYSIEDEFKGSSSARVRFGDYYAKPSFGPLKQDKKTAFKYYQMATAPLSYPRPSFLAYERLAVCYATGFGTLKDEGQALETYKEALQNLDWEIADLKRAHEKILTEYPKGSNEEKKSKTALLKSQLKFQQLKSEELLLVKRIKGIS